ncbi:MAG: hypothetical protein ACK41E_01230 [Deinococcales bacterium]
MKRFALFTLVIALAACQINTSPSLTKPTRAIGTLEVHFGTEKITTRARFTPKSQLKPQGLLDETQLTFSASAVQVVQTASRRFLSASFQIKNASPAAIDNLTLVAYVKSGNQAQTAIKNAQNFVGAALDLNAFVQDIRPAPGVNSDTTVNSNLADLMLFSEAETSTLQTEAAGILQETEYLLPYGYVARNTVNGRSIATNTSSPTGTINIGLNIPANNDPVASTYRFSMTFVVFENPTGTTRVVQGLEEQLSNSNIDQRVAQTGATEVVVLHGSSYPTNVATVKVLCDVRTAGSAAAVEAVLLASPVLAIGQPAHFTGETSATRCIKNTDSSTAEYIAIPSNLASSGNQSLSLLAQNISAPTITPYWAPLHPQNLGAQTAIEVRPPQENLDALLRRPNSRIPLKRPIQTSKIRTQGITPGVPAVGSTMVLNVASGCNAMLDQRRGIVKFVSDHLIVIADENNPPGGFTDLQYQQIATTGQLGSGSPPYGFDEDIYDSVINAFGTPADRDNNGRIIAFFTSAVNELDPTGSGVVGYFSARDLFSKASCPGSNEGEILYMMVPDPTGVVNSNVPTVSFVAGTAPRVLGAEFQRLINASRRIYITNAPSLETSWLETGLSDIAEELIFYHNSLGLSPNSNIITANLTTGPNASLRVQAFNTFANPNYGRLRDALRRPDIRSPFAANSASDELGRRGALWNFLRYIADRKIPSGSQSAFWASLVDSSFTGSANLQNAIGAGNDLNLARNVWL